MRLTETQNILEAALRAAGYTNSVYNGDPYDLWNNKEVSYVSACYEVQQMEITEATKSYQFIVYVADRLTEDGDNTLAALDACEAVLEAAVAYLNTAGVVGVNVDYCYPFMQKFADNLAGYYATLTVEVDKDINYCDQ